MQDYLYKNGSGYEILIEVSCCKYPKASLLREFWESNKDALINLMFAVHMGMCFIFSVSYNVVSSLREETVLTVILHNVIVANQCIPRGGVRA